MMILEQSVAGPGKAVPRIDQGGSLEDSGDWAFDHPMAKLLQEPARAFAEGPGLRV